MSEEVVRYDGGVNKLLVLTSLFCALFGVQLLLAVLL